MPLIEKTVKRERNSELLKDYNEKVLTKEWTIVDLVAKYRISSTMIYRIIGRNKKN